MVGHLKKKKLELEKVINTPVVTAPVVKKKSLKKED